jgi:hypothetical protein
VPHQAIGDYFSVVGLLLPVDFGKGLMDDFFVIVFDGGQLAQLAPFLIVTLLGVALLALQLEVAEGAEQPHFFPHQIFHFYYEPSSPTSIFKRLLYLCYNFDGIIQKFDKSLEYGMALSFHAANSINHEKMKTTLSRLRTLSTFIIRKNI